MFTIRYSTGFCVNFADFATREECDDFLARAHAHIKWAKLYHPNGGLILEFDKTSLNWVVPLAPLPQVG